MATSGRTQSKRVDVSVTRWVLGGSLVSVTATNTMAQGKSTSKKSVVVEEVKEDEVEEIIYVKKRKNKTKPKDGEKEKNKTEEDEAKVDRKVDDKPGKKDEMNEVKDDSPKAQSGSETKDVKGWTEKQDNTIKAMKQKNATWKEIALAVSASKKDCQHRFKELESKKEGGDVAEEHDMLGGLGLVVEENEKSGNENDGQKKKKKKGCGAKDCCRGEGCEHGPGHGHKQNSSGTKGNEGVSDAGEGFRNQQSENTHDIENSSWSGNNSNRVNGDEPMWYDLPENGGDGGQNTGDQQQNNNHENAGGDGGGSGGRDKHDGRLKPDDAWSRHDLEVLEWLASKYDENKWVHIQAGFFNWTGKMVVAQIIEQKFRDHGLA